MGLRGPLRKSRELERLHGNVGHQRKERMRTRTDLEGAGVLWEPPAWLDGEQRRVWRRALDNAPVGLLTATDRDCLVVFTVAAVEYARAVCKIREEGQMVQTAAGNQTPNPYLGVANTQARILLKAGRELGFSPAARRSLGDLPEEGTGRGRGSLAAFLDEKPDNLN